VRKISKGRHLNHVKGHMFNPLSMTVPRQFQRIQDLAKTKNDSPVGVLTTENRDTWAEARQIILDASPDNKKALERVESAIVIVALDDSRPITREQISRAIWFGDGRSRWSLVLEKRSL
jgi:carnitine O-acetyltransferase